MQNDFCTLNLVKILIKLKINIHTKNKFIYSLISNYEINIFEFFFKKRNITKSIIQRFLFDNFMTLSDLTQEKEIFLYRVAKIMEKKQEKVENFLRYRNRHYLITNKFEI